MKRVGKAGQMDRNGLHGVRGRDIKGGERQGKR